MILGRWALLVGMTRQSGAKSDGSRVHGEFRRAVAMPCSGQHRRAINRLPSRWNGSSSSRHGRAGAAALVDRHGAMVLRVCRQILRDEHNAQMPHRRRS